MSVRRRERKRKIIMPGSTQEAGSLILPGVDRETVTVGLCHTCGAQFYGGEEEEWQRHVGDCARANLPEIMAAREDHKRRMAIFQPDAWDPEYRAHMDKVGARMKREGRLVPKPHER